MALRRTARRLSNIRNHHRYSDGTGRKLEAATGPEGIYLEPLNDPRKSNSYPARAGHWQPAIAGEPNPFKGNVLVCGAGVVGAAAASMFALRGWHVTIIDQQPPDMDELEVCGLETVLITKRALDALDVCGIKKDALKAMGTKVNGIMDHPGTAGSALTAGLSEFSQFPVNMLVVPLKTLRASATATLQAIPHRNARVFHSHKLVALIPDAKTAVVKPLHEEVAAAKGPANTEDNEIVIAGRRFEDNVEGITFDVMVGADGIDSPTRRFLDAPEEVKMHAHYAVRWYAVTKAMQLEPGCVHRWCHKFNVETDPERSLGVIFAFPRGAPEAGEFTIMAHMPRVILEAQSQEEFIRSWCPEMDGCEVITGRNSVSKIKPSFTLFNKELCNNHMDFPNVILVGDAAHHRNPFLLENLACGLEDVANAVNNIDSVGVSVWDRVRQYSRERGVSGDCLRIITERSLYYAKARHYNPLLRLRNLYTHSMHYLCPRSIQEYYSSVHNWMFPRSVEVMLRGRGYASYEAIDHAQFRVNRWWAFGRLFT